MKNIGENKMCRKRKAYLTVKAKYGVIKSVSWLKAGKYEKGIFETVDGEVVVMWLKGKK
ncbi:hypothetical protein JK208_11885 [Gluconobacter sp. Dm-74]|uniref:hypothetical protein n=1 Tax=Gluconobacter sp. Dm-74 TaxID=2799803 RepID=UPI001B8B8748|nr:hypothetical protein [Gluconobacter sp. Dm-74]MBS1092312.1 hypothetical protein [Gluconobacter sp. Dm-74]